MIESYSKSKVASFKQTLLSIMCRIANRFEFDLSHIQHWQHENVNGFKALTTFQWERCMKRYYKLFVRTLEIALDLISQHSIDDSEEEHNFAKEVGISIYA